MDTFCTHPLSCCFSPGRISRNSALNGIVQRGLSASGIPSGLDRGDGKRPDGITVYPYSRGRCLICDTTCVNKFASSNLIRAPLAAGPSPTLLNSGKLPSMLSCAEASSFSQLLLLLARLINRQDVVFDKKRKFGSFGCRQCR